MEDSVDAIKAGSDDTAGTGDDFADLVAFYQGTFAYTYTFDGQAGYLDHALASASLAAQVAGAATWHINSDEPDAFDYDTGFKPPAQDALYEPNAYRSSDHDAIVVGLNLFSWTGFFQPVDDLPALNKAKAGSAIPLKFSLGGDMGLDILAANSPSSYPVVCEAVAAGDAIEQTVTAGGSSLSYDAISGQYIYVWKTSKGWANTCRQLELKLVDGTTHYALFYFTK
jgi:hypothetical protein